MANILYTARPTRHATRRNQRPSVTKVSPSRNDTSLPCRPIVILVIEGSDSCKAYGDKKNQYHVENYSCINSSDFSDSPGFFKTSALQCRRLSFGEE